MRPFLLMIALAVPAVLTAQKLPMPDHGDRQLQLFDVRELLGSREEHDAAPAAVTSPAEQNETLRALADFLRHFIEPPLGSGDDLQPLAGRWLALVGSAQQIAIVERLLATAQARRDELLNVEVRFVRLSAKAFDAALKGKLVGVQRGTVTTWENVFPAAGSKDLLAEIVTGDVDYVESPRLSVRSMQRATMSVINQTAYVQDFTITKQGDSLIADPVIGTAWDGVKADVVACFEKDGTIGVSCDVEWQELVRPLAEVETTLPGVKTPLKIQLPRTHGVRLRQVAHVHDGDLLVLAAQRADGDYLVAVMKTAIDPATRKPR
ncbi:MAG TPA: hypothetical protein VF384_03560 [Planctomycetota bacterium]